MTAERKSTRVVYQNRWMRVREDSIVREDGSDGIYGVVEKPDFALVIPRDGDHVHLVEQFRYAVGARFYEFPQGSWEDRPHADPEEVARGELEEETGLNAGTLEHLGYLYEAYGYSTQGFHVYLATDLEEGSPRLAPEERDLRSRRVPIAALEQMIRAGDMKDAASVAAYGLLRLI
jgi:8-oxo-dGTP pyrophosphatase MutT (NUDIX family)